MPQPGSLSADLLRVAPIPQHVGESPAPVVQAASAIIYDLGTGKILYEKNAYRSRYVASLTKLMTAVVARENYQLDESVIISRTASEQPAAKVWLRAGEQISVRGLLAGALIESGNDAAYALAEHFGKIEDFVAQMNTKAKMLGLKNTHFSNPVGFDSPNNYSSAYDLAILSSYVLRDPVLREIAETQRLEIFDTSGNISHKLLSTNILFNSYLDIRGLKTGSTKDAGECLAAVARTPEGRNILAIVLASPNRFQEAKSMLEWAHLNYRW